MRMVGTGKAPQGYHEGQTFDVATDSEADDLERRGWAKRQDPADDPARTRVQIANAMVRGDPITDPYDRAVAVEIGSHDAALAIVHLEDPDASEEDYEDEVEEAKNRNAVGEPISKEERAVFESDAARMASGGQNWDPDSPDAQGGLGEEPRDEGADDEESGPEEPYSGYGDKKADEIAGEVGEGKHDDDLDAIAGYENAQKHPRKSVLEAVEARREASKEGNGS